MNDPNILQELTAMASGGEVRSNQSQPTPNALHSDSRRVQYAEKAVALDPLCPRYQSLLGETLAAAGRTEDALRLLHSNIEVDPDYRFKPYLVGRNARLEIGPSRPNRVACSAATRNIRKPSKPGTRRPTSVFPVSLFPRNHRAQILPISVLSCCSCLRIPRECLGAPGERA